MNEKITVIVPVYNVKKYLRQALDSIINQSYKNYKVVIVDDGSTDGCGKICDEYADIDSRIKVIHKTNGGLMSAWICGLEQTATEFVVFVDSDDYIAADMLEIFDNEQKKQNSDIIIGNYRWVNGSKEKRAVEKCNTGFYDKDKIKKEIYPTMINTGKFQNRGIELSRWGKMIRTELIKKNLKYCDLRVSYGEDLNIMVPVLCDCKTIAIIDDENADYFYRMNKQSIIHSYKATMYQQVRILYNKLYKVIHKKEMDIFEQQLQADYLAAIVQCYKNELSNPDGLKRIIKNIDLMHNDHLLQKAITEVDWKKYDKKNKIIIHILKNWNFFEKNVATRMLRIMKKG